MRDMNRLALMSSCASQSVSRARTKAANKRKPNTRNPSMQLMLTFVLSLFGTAISWGVYQLSIAQREDAWLRTLWDFQRAFWQDEKMETVRRWIACDQAYTEEIRPILLKRLGNLPIPTATATNLTPDEYKKLETLDRFAAVLTAYAQISPPTSIRHNNIKYRIFDEYWLKSATEKNRPEMHTYFKSFYPELISKNSNKNNHRTN